MSKQFYSIKLYRSPLFKIVHFILLLIIVLLLVDEAYSIWATGFYEYFFWRTDNVLSKDLAIPAGVMDILFEGIYFVLYTFILFLLVKALFFNRITVYDKHLFMHFAPRFFFKKYKVDVHSIERISANEAVLWKRICSYNFEKQHLYKFTCYNSVFYISSKDEAGMGKLMAEINPHNNPLESDEKDYNPNKIHFDDAFVAFLILSLLLGVLRTIYCVIVALFTYCLI